jgi:hypothetical protein
MIHKLYKCTDKYKNLERIARKRYKKDECIHIHDFFYYHVLANQVLKKG